MGEAPLQPASDLGALSASLAEVRERTAAAAEGWFEELLAEERRHYGRRLEEALAKVEAALARIEQLEAQLAEATRRADASVADATAMIVAVAMQGFDDLPQA